MSANLAYVRFELRRSFRNRRYYIISLIRSCRVQPTWRSPAIRMPLVSIAIIVPNDESDTM